MKQPIFKMIGLAMSLFAFSASAEFVPVPTQEELPLRLFLGVNENNVWSPAALHALQGNASLVMGLGMGFDFGLMIHGGVGNDKGLFKAGNSADGLIGGDVMLRYLTHATDLLFLGVQAQAGYSQNLSATNLVPDGANIPVDAGLVVGLNFADVINIYAFPGFEFGRKTAAETAVWGSLIGLNVAAGMMIDFGGTSLVLQGKPRWGNMSDMSNTFSTTFLAGLAWDM